MNGPEVIVPVTLFISTAAMIFGIVYMKTRQNLAMIEKGMNPKEFANRPAPYKNLKWALLLVGAGLGLFLAYVLNTYIFQNLNGHDPDNPAIYFALIAIGGGLGLYGSYKIEKKWWDENKGNI